MATVGIAIDNWKLPIFKRHLDEACYSYTEHPGLMADAMILKVKAERIAKLQKVIERAQLECISS